MELKAFFYFQLHLMDVRLNSALFCVVFTDRHFQKITFIYDLSTRQWTFLSLFILYLSFFKYKLISFCNGYDESVKEDFITCVFDLLRGFFFFFGRARQGRLKAIPAAPLMYCTLNPAFTLLTFYSESTSYLSGGG